jgi:amino acid transporter
MMSESNALPRDETPRLLRVLTFFDLLVYGLAYVSPIGPWSTWKFTSDLAGGAVSLAYLLGAGALSFTAFSYAKMTLEVPDAGSAYSYARFAMGEGVGFLTGWMVLLDYLLLPALMYVFCGATLAEFTPALPAWGWILVIATYNIAVNWFGIKTSARFNFGTLLVQFAMLFIFLVAGIYTLAKTGAPMFTADPWLNSNTSSAGVFSAASLCVMAYLGFDAITTLSSEVRPEQRSLVGRSVIATLAIMGVLAVIHVWVLSDLSRGLTFKDPTVATFETIKLRINPILGIAAAWGAVLVTAVSITPPMVTAVARVLYSMALNNEMPHLLVRLHPRYGVPHVALLASGVISIAVALYFSSQFDTLTSMVNFGALTAFVAVNSSVIALFIVKRKSGKWLAHLVGPALGIAVLLAVLAQMSAIGLGVGFTWMVIGVVAYHFVRRRNKQALNNGRPATQWSTSSVDPTK